MGVGSERNGRRERPQRDEDQMRWVVGEHESGVGVETSAIDSEYASLLAVMSRGLGRAELCGKGVALEVRKAAWKADPDEHARGVQW